jgi:hypothetical protein
MTATVTIVGGTVQIAVEGQLVRSHPIRHDRGQGARCARQPHERINAAPSRTLADAV